MTEYIITPDKREIPSSHLLSEELHRRALSVEMEVKGTNYKWESIHFYDPAVPETQCFIERNLHSHVFKVSLPLDSTQESADMQQALVEIFLQEVGGKVFDVEAKQSLDLKAFKRIARNNGPESDPAPLSPLSGTKMKFSSRSLSEIGWLVFAWGIVFAGLYLYLHTSPERKLFMGIAVLLALVSAGGMTYSINRSR